MLKRSRVNSASPRAQATAEAEDEAAVASPAVNETTSPSGGDDEGRERSLACQASL